MPVGDVGYVDKLRVEPTGEIRTWLVTYWFVHAINGLPVTKVYSETWDESEKSATAFLSDVSDALTTEFGS